MTYHSTRPRRMIIAKPKGLGDSPIDWVMGMLNVGSGGAIPASLDQAASADCTAAATAASAALDAKTADLQRTWLPTGYYSPDQVQQLGANTLTMLMGAANVVTQTLTEPMAPGAKDALQPFLNDIQTRMSESAQFTDAIRQANAAGITALDSPGLKRWIVNSMTTASSGISAATYVACMTPWWVSALAKFQAAFDAVWNLAKTIAGIIVELGQAVLKIPDALDTVWTILKWGALLGGAYFLGRETGLIPADPLGLRGK